MFYRLTVSFRGGRGFTLFVHGERVDILGTLLGRSTRYGSARWDGASLTGCTAPVRPELLRLFADALRSTEPRFDRSAAP